MPFLRLTNVKGSWKFPPPEVTEYYTKVLATETANLIAYWPLWETTGVIANDISGLNNHGSFTSVTLGQTGIGDGYTSPYFDGTTSYMDGFSSALAALFNGREGTAMLWLKNNDWTKTSTFIYISRSSSNHLYSSKPSPTPGSLRFFYKAALAENTIVDDTGSPAGWKTIILTWSYSADQVKLYYGGTQLGATSTGLGAWIATGVITKCLIGAKTDTPIEACEGNIAHVALWNKVLTLPQVVSLSTVI